MNILLSIDIKTILIKDLFDACHLKIVRGYCQSCNNFGQNYSCPPHAPDGKAYFDDYTQVTLIMSKLDTKKLNQNIRLLNQKTYNSETLISYRNADTDKYAEISMYSFDIIKNKLSSKLLLIEDDFNALSIPPGKCNLCASCALRQKMPCRYPSRVRYSLESLGFLVSELLMTHFNTELGWAKGAFPKHFITLSALVSQNPIDELKLSRSLNGIHITY